MYTYVHIYMTHGIDRQLLWTMERTSLPALWVILPWKLLSKKAWSNLVQHLETQPTKTHNRCVLLLLLMAFSNVSSRVEEQEEEEI